MRVCIRWSGTPAVAVVVADPMRKESPEKRRNGVLLQHLNDLLLLRVAGHNHIEQQITINMLPVPLPCTEVPGMLLLHTIPVTLSVGTPSECPGEAVSSSDVSEV